MDRTGAALTLNASEEYLRTASAAMADRYTGDCLQHARTIRDHLTAEGRDAWIGRLRKTEKRGDTTYHGPLTPLRFRGRAGATWTTHYVCCSGDQAYDPLLDFPIHLDVYSVAVFGEKIAIERITEE